MNWSEFRFLAICEGVSQGPEENGVTLRDVVNTLKTTGERPTELTAAIGPVLHPEWQAKCLDLMAWRLGKSGQREKIPDYAGSPPILPEGRGPKVLPYQVRFCIPATGYYGFELFDRDGIFGTREALLATYVYFAEVEKTPAHST